MPGGNTALGSSDRPGVFGTTQFGDGLRIVWHYRATDEQRATILSYRVRDAVVAYDDVLDIGWAVWGDQWDFDLDHLTASFTNRGSTRPTPCTASGAIRTTLRARPCAVPARPRSRPTTSTAVSAVEMRVTMPRDPNRALPGCREGAGDGLDKIIAEEQAIHDDINSPWNRFKRFVSSTRSCWRSRSPRWRGCSSAC